jgi:hypothetical protein
LEGGGRRWRERRACTVASSRACQLLDEIPAASLGRVRAVELGERLVCAWVEFWSSPRLSFSSYIHRNEMWGGQHGRVDGDARGAHWGSAGRFGFEGAPGACKGERERCSRLQGCCPRDLEQQREEEGGIHPCRPCQGRDATAEFPSWSRGGTGGRSRVYRCFRFGCIWVACNVGSKCSPSPGLTFSPFPFSSLTRWRNGHACPCVCRVNYEKRGIERDGGLAACAWS